MTPDNAAPPAPSDPYQFIMEPPKASKKRWLSGLIKSDFVRNLVLIIGGAVVLMVVSALAVNMFLGNKNNLEDVVGLVQTETEIVRVVGHVDKTSNQALKDAAANTSLSLNSQQQSWLGFLEKKGRKVKTSELSLKKDAATDKKLTAAQEAGNFDQTFAQVVSDQLKTYSKAIKTSLDHATNQAERRALMDHYGEVQLLLHQWSL